MQYIYFNMELLSLITKTKDYIGYLGPFLLLTSSVYLLKNKSTLLSVYLAGYIINIIVNVVLKHIIKQPRPSEDLSLFNASIAHGRRMSFDVYGMPSGHAENVFYSTAFIFFALKSPLISIIYLILAINTCHQRIKYKNHTLLQVICGAFMGIVVGYVAYLYGANSLMGKLKYKKDDNAPL